MTTQANINQPLQVLNWIAESALEDAGVASQLTPWLLEKGLLTSRVQQFCRRSFRLQVLNHNDPGSNWLRRFEDWAPCQGEQREIVMWCDDTPGLYAETVIPADTAEAQPWLRTLGTQPLGERLQQMEGVSRSHLDFACIPVADNADIPGSWYNPGQHCLWARRSHYNVQQSKLWVIEVFLGAIDQ